MLKLWAESKVKIEEEREGRGRRRECESVEGGEEGWKKTWRCSYKVLKYENNKIFYENKVKLVSKYVFNFAFDS